MSTGSARFAMTLRIYWCLLVKATLLELYQWGDICVEVSPGVGAWSHLWLLPGPPRTLYSCFCSRTCAVSQPALAQAGGRADGVSTNHSADWAAPWQAGPVGTVADFLALNTWERLHFPFSFSSLPSYFLILFPSSFVFILYSFSFHPPFLSLFPSFSFPHLFPFLSSSFPFFLPTFLFCCFLLLFHILSFFFLFFFISSACVCVLVHVQQAGAPARSWRDGVTRLNLSRIDESFKPVIYFFFS